MSAAATTGFLTVALMSSSLVPPAPLATPVLRQRMAEAQDRLWAWEFEYESPRQDGRGVPAESYLHRVVAVKAPDRFFHWNAHGTPWLDWRDDPLQQRLTIAGDRFFTERPLDRVYAEHELPPGDRLPGTAPNELLLTALGWWPLTTRPSPLLTGNLPSDLRAVARSPDYRGREKLEQIEGRWCHVLECPERDVLWLDADRDCVTVARQTTYSNPPLIHRIEFADFREVNPRVWAPFRFRNMHIERSPDGSAGKVVHDATLLVLRVRLNESVDDSRFRVEPPPGSIGRIGEKELRQSVPGGEEYLDEVADWLRRCAAWGRPVPPQDGRTGWGDTALGASVGVGVVALIVAWRRWGPRQRGVT